jgi:hypothetical protein
MWFYFLLHSLCALKVKTCLIPNIYYYIHVLLPSRFKLKPLKKPLIIPMWVAYFPTIEKYYHYLFSQNTNQNMHRNMHVLHCHLVSALEIAWLEVFNTLPIHILLNLVANLSFVHVTLDSSIVTCLVVLFKHYFKIFWDGTCSHLLFHVWHNLIKMQCETPQEAIKSSKKLFIKSY